MERSFGWKLVNSWWILVVVLGLGCLSGAGFIYAGLRTRRPAWWGAGIVYLVLIWAGVLGIDQSPHGSTRLTTVAMAYYAVWFASIVHAFIINPSYLRRLAARRPAAALAPPPVFAPPSPSAPPPAFAPPPPSAVDVNGAGPTQLLELGVRDPDRLIADREARGGFQTVEEFAATAGLAPHEFARARAHLTCVPRPRAPQAPQPPGGGRVLDF